MPQLKVLLCAVGKSGCSSLTDIICSINKNRPTDKPRMRVGPWELGCGYNVAHPSRLGINKTSYRSWSRIAFVRDPLERLLSGYLSKCGGADPGGPQICSDVFGGPNVTFAAAAAKAAAGDVGWMRQHAWSHFQRQYEFCGGLEDGWLVHRIQNRSSMPLVLAALLQDHGRNPGLEPSLYVQLVSNTCTCA